MEHAQKTIEMLEQNLLELITQERKIKITINCLCDVLGEPIRYPDTGEAANRMLSPRADQYYGQPFATAATEALEKRKAAGLGAATDDELFTELVAGGFKFKGKDECIQKRVMAITLAKNPKFTKVGNNSWGLTVWYPEAVKARAKKGNGRSETEEDQGVAETVQEAFDNEEDKEKRTTDAA